MNAPRHLHPGTARLLELSKQDRLKACYTEQWFHNCQTRQVFAELDALSGATANPRTHLLLNIDYANGKTSMLTHYADSINAIVALGPAKCIPVAYGYGANKVSNLEWHYALLRILKADDLFDLYSETSDLVALFEQRKVRLLLLDDMDGLISSLDSRHKNWWRAILQWCEGLSIRLVVSCMPKAARQLLAQPELAASFRHLSLPLRTYGLEYRSVLSEYEKRLPLWRASNLEGEEIAQKLLVMSMGRMALLARVLRLATQAAIRNGQECITVNLLHMLNCDTAFDIPNELYG